MINLPVLPLTKSNFLPFGDLLTLEQANHFPINSGSTERYHALSQIDVSDAGGNGIISLFRGQAFQLPFQLRVMERHPLGSQTFIPLNPSTGQSYLIIVAPASCANEAKITAQLCAFIAHGFEGITYAKGVWHHPLISLHTTGDFIVIDRLGAGNNCDEITITSTIQISE